MQLQTPDPLPIVEALRKIGYEVGWPSIDPGAAEFMGTSEGVEAAAGLVREVVPN